MNTMEAAHAIRGHIGGGSRELQDCDCRCGQYLDHLLDHIEALEDELEIRNQRIEDHDTPGRMDADAAWQQEREDEADGWE